MGLFLLALFILWALAELAALSAVAGAVGIFDALAILLLISVAGAFLTKRAGFGAAQRVRGAQAEGRLPSNELTEGLLIFVAGVLLVVPGFVSGALGLLLLLPPVRVGARLLVVRRFRGYGDMVVVRTQDRSRTEARDVLDAESWEDPPDDPPGHSEIEAPR